MSLLSMDKNKRKIGVIVSVSLAAMIGVAGTFAWFTAKDSVRNRISTDVITDGSTNIVEVFEPPAQWRPGEEITKRVSVVNTGGGDVLARVSFEEVMKKLKTPAKANAQPAADPQVPQLFETKPYTQANGEWKDPSALGLNLSKTMPNVTIKGVKLTTGTPPNEKNAYSFVLWYSFQTGTYQGKAQKMTADFQVSGNTLNITNEKYWAYDGKNESTAAWARFADPKTSAVPTLPDNSADITIPKTDAGKMLHLNYANKNDVIGTTPVAGKWWYNKTDGFFYYMGKVESGGMTPSFMDSLSLDPAAGAEYSGMDFDLIVNLEAIQNTRDAIKSATGWNIPETSALFIELSKYCS